jgi:hypothetical protein
MINEMLVDNNKFTSKCANRMGSKTAIRLREVASSTHKIVPTLNLEENTKSFLRLGQRPRWVLWEACLVVVEVVGEVAAVEA